MLGVLFFLIHLGLAIATYYAVLWWGKSNPIYLSLATATFYVVTAVWLFDYLFKRKGN